MRRALLLLALAAVAAPLPAAPSHWQRVISPRDRTRLREWRTIWQDALAQARAAGFADRIAAEGALLQPDAALPRPDAPDGAYRCRLVKVGRTANSPASGFVPLPTGRCRIAGGRLDALDGMQRPGGALFRYDDARLLLLGGLAVGDERGTVRYGRDDQRDLLGLFERIGPARWRVAFPQPAWGSRLDVLELVPAAP